MEEVGLFPAALRVKKKNLIVLISTRDDSAASTLTAFIALHPEEALGWNITVIVAVFPQGQRRCVCRRGSKGLAQRPIGLVGKEIQWRRERGVHVHTLDVVNVRGHEKEEVK